MNRFLPKGSAIPALTLAALITASCSTITSNNLDMYPRPPSPSSPAPPARDADDSARTENPGGKDLGRAAPAYIQFLERQSLLRQTPALAAIVSGSSLPWNAPSARSDSGSLLRSAPNWFHFNPLFASWQGKSPALSALASGPLPSQLKFLEVRGLFLSPLAESGLTWGMDPTFSQRGMDLVGFTVAPDLGGDEAYAALERKTAANLMLGGDVLPSATGLGPDFSLALRGVREYPGLYMMVDIPQELWDKLPLPRFNSSSEGRVLSPAQIAALSREGILPPAFSRDRDCSVRYGGWAVSSEVVGVDGVNRRWAYRFSGSPLRPVLNWDDPSGTARRVLSASIIQQVGLLHQPLVALSIEALWGQDPVPLNAPASFTTPEPALSALRALSREARRYGAWTMLRDPFPTGKIFLLQDTEVDFVFDSVTSPSLEYALLTGDTAPLKSAIDASLKNGVDYTRLWRAAPDGLGIDFGLAGLDGDRALNAFFIETFSSRGKSASSADERGGGSFPVQAAPSASPVPRGASPSAESEVLVDTATTPAPAGAPPAGVVLERRWTRKTNPGWVALLPVRNNVLHATAASLSAAAAGLSPQQAQAAQADPQVAKAIADVHLLQVAFRAFQPGLLFVSGQDLSGSLFSSGEGVPSLTGWSMDGSVQPATRQGIPSGNLAYGSLAAQFSDPESFAVRLRKILSARAETGVAAGSFAGRANVAEASGVGVVTRLPDGRYLLCVGNFSGKGYVTGVALPQGIRGSGCTDLISGGNVNLHGGGLRLRMEPWGFRAVLIR